MATLTTNAKLRSLLRTARGTARLSQKEAASKAGVSVAWWKRVESAHETTVMPDTLVTMLDAVGVVPQHLSDLGELALAGMLRDRLDFKQAAGEATPRESLEDYLLKAPADDATRAALVSFSRSLTSLRRRTEPFQDELLPPR